MLDVATNIKIYEVFMVLVSIFFQVPEAGEPGPAEPEPEPRSAEPEPDSPPLSTAASSLTYLKELSQTVDYKLELQKSYQIIYDLKDQLKSYIVDFDILKNDNEQCRFYTGFNYNKLNAIFILIENFKPARKVTKSQQFLIFMIKLKQNLLFTDLGYRFKIDRRTVSRIFFDLLHILFSRLKWAIVWPSRKVIRENMPACFSGFPDVSIIIDCFEIMCENPSSKEAASQHFSHYKHHNTVKFLIGISPQGTVMFISKSFGGRCSDKFITEHCGILDNLIPGDKILADRGFLISEQVNMCMAELVVPPYLKGRRQLNPIEIEKNRSISNVRIHVERVIGNIKNKFAIMTERIPMHLVQQKQGEIPVLDKIATVCCALCNLCPPIVAV